MLSFHPPLDMLSYIYLNKQDTQMSLLPGDGINITDYGRLLYLSSFNLLQPEQLKTKLLAGSARFSSSHLMFLLMSIVVSWWSHTRCHRSRVVQVGFPTLVLNIRIGDPPQKKCWSAILWVVNDLLCSVNGSKVVPLTLLDVSAAFDKINRGLLLQRLEGENGVKGPNLRSPGPAPI